MKGNPRGVIQFINKKFNDDIEEKDSYEINALLPALGELIKTADE